MTKYYYKIQSADTRSIGIVKLTDEEYEIIKDFLDAPYDVSANIWCGNCSISEKGYDTYDEAVSAALAW